MNGTSVNPTFTSRSFDDEQAKLVQQFQIDFSLLEDRILTIPHSRLRSLALTRLEETAMIVTKAVSRMRDSE